MKYLIILLFSIPAFAMQPHEKFYATQSGINLKLIKATHHEDPFQLLGALSNYYHMQHPDKKGWLACLANPCVNIKKVVPHIQLYRAVNQEVYVPAILGLKSEEEVERVIEENDLETKADQGFNQRWPLISVWYDLQDQEKRLLKARAHAKQVKLQLSQGTQAQLDIRKILSASKKDAHSVARARAIIDKKDLIQDMHAHPFDFIIQHARIYHLQKTLRSIEVSKFLPYLNEQVKANNTNGNSLLHDLCLSSLNTDQFKEAVIALTDGGIHINEHNNADQTPLDYAVSKNASSEFISILQSLGAEKALPKKESLKTSSDSSSPQGSPTPQKKKLRISLSGRLPIK